MVAGARPTLTDLPASRLAELTRSREVSPVEIMDAHLERIEALNPQLNAIVTVRAAEAREEARVAERLAGLNEGGLLCGVPFTVKDTIATKGVRTTCGSRMMAEHVPTYDATAVARLKAAGAILLGKTNCPEFGLGIHTWNALFGETKNPFSGVTPGGSSGGECAAIAAGCSALGLGTDFGGSLRWPAHCTGTVGLRPTVGRVPGTGQLPGRPELEPAIPNALSLQGRLQVVGPLARTVEDVERALRVIAGADGIDPAAVPVAFQERPDIRSMRVAWCGGDGSVPVSDEVVKAVEGAAAVVADTGARVEEFRPPPLKHAAEIYTRLRDLDGAGDLACAVAGRRELLTAPIRALLDQPPSDAVDLAAIAELWAQRNVLRAEMLRFLHEVPILLMPVATVPAPSVEPATPERALSQWDLVQPSRVISLFGFPAMAVRASSTAEGLPVAVQVVGRPFREEDVITVGRVIEDAGADPTR